MNFDIEAARKEGYSDDEIADFLAQQRGFDIKSARGEGYQAAEIIDFLAKPAASPAPVAKDPAQPKGNLLEVAARGPAAPRGRGFSGSKPPAPKPPERGLLEGSPDFKPSQADLEWASLSPAEQERRIRAQRGVATGTISAAKPRTLAQNILDRTLAKPLDNSLGGLALETLGDVARGGLQGANDIRQGLYGAVQKAGVLTGSDALEVLGANESAISREASQGLVNARDPGSITQQASRGLASSLPAMAVGPAGGAALIMGTSGFKEYSDSRAAGATEDEATTRGAVMGVTEWLGEALPIKSTQALFKTAAKGGSPREIAQRIADVYIKDGLGEQATLAMQSFYEKNGIYGKRPDMTLADYIEDAVETAKVSAVASTLAGGAGASVAAVQRQRQRGVEAPLSTPSGQDYQGLVSRAFNAPPRVEDQRTTVFTPEEILSAPTPPAQNDQPAAQNTQDQAKAGEKAQQPQAAPVPQQAQAGSDPAEGAGGSRPQPAAPNPGAAPVATAPAPVASKVDLNDPNAVLATVFGGGAASVLPGADAGRSADAGGGADAVGLRAGGVDDAARAAAPTDPAGSPVAAGLGGRQPVVPAVGSTDAQAQATTPLQPGVARPGESDVVAANAQRVAATNAAFATNQRAGAPADLTPAAPELVQSFAPVAQAVAEVFGTEPVALAESGAIYDGVNFRGRTVVNVSGLQKPAAFVAAHETVHTLQNLAEQGQRNQEAGQPVTPEQADAQRIWAPMEAAIWEMVPQAERVKYARRALGRAGTDAEVEAWMAEPANARTMRRELLADFSAKRLTSKQDIEALAQREPALFGDFAKRMIDGLSKVIEKLRGSLRGKLGANDVDKHIRDLQKAKLLWQDAMIGWKKRGGANATPVASPAPAAAASEPAASARERSEDGLASMDEESTRYLEMTQRMVREWQQKLGDDIEIIMGGSLVSGTFVQTGNDPIDMDVRFLTKDPKAAVPRIEEVTGLQLRKTIQASDFPLGSSEAFMVEGFIEVDGVTVEVEGAVRSPDYVGWANFYRKVFSEQELAEFRDGKRRLKGGDKKAYKAFKNKMLAEGQARAIARGLVPERAYTTPESWKLAPNGKALIDDKGNERGLGLSATERFVEQQFFDMLDADEAGVIDAYLRENPGVVDADLAKDQSRVYVLNKNYANAVHEPSSRLAKAAWSEALKRDSRKDVIFTAGGAGSGKSFSGQRVREQLGIPHDTLTFDSAFTSMGPATRIDEAVAQGRRVTIIYTNTEASLAFRWSLGRERLMRSNVVASSHARASENIRALEQRYAGNPNVTIKVMDNLGNNTVRESTVANVMVYNYNQLEKDLYEIATQERDAGRLAEDRYRFVVREVLDRGLERTPGRDGEGGQGLARDRGREGQPANEVRGGEPAVDGQPAEGDGRQDGVGVYASRPVEDGQKILDWAKRVGIKNLVPLDELHVTQVYSRQPFDYESLTPAAPQVRAFVTGIERMGTKGDIVLRVRSQALDARHKEAMAAGASYDYDEYRPHITLSYGGDPGLDLDAIKPPPMSVLLGPETSEALQPGDNDVDEPSASARQFDIRSLKEGSLKVLGDVDAMRALLPDDVKGRKIPGGLLFTPSAAPRAKAALEGRKLAYSRAGRVTELSMKDGKYVGAPEKFNTPQKIPQLRKILRQLAEEGAPGRFWYENSSKEVLQMVGGDVQEARKFVALLAIYSPQAKVDTNSTFALRAWSQYKAGQPISVKTKVMDDKATAALNDIDAFWSGEKTGNFFNNLLREIDPSVADKQGATIDMWMMRAAQYASDAPTATQYAFMENENNRLARDLGWEPQQVQAAIWVAMKARTENKGVKEKTEAISESKGWIRFDRDDKGKKVRVILDAQKHRDNWLDQAMKHDVTKSDTQTAKFDFSDGVRRHIGQVSWEARPGRSTGVLPGVNDAPYEQQVEFQQAVQKALYSEEGADLLAQQLGLLVDGPDVLAPGVWQGEIAAGMQKQVAMAPGKGEDGKTIDPSQKQALDTYAAVLGLLLRQEGVGWHRPFYKGKRSAENAVEINVGRPFTPEEAQALWGATDKAMRDAGVVNWEQGAGLISSPVGMRLVNFGAVDNNAKFRDLINDKVAPTLPFEEVTLTEFSTDGNLVFNDWKEAPRGQGYQQGIREAGRSDLLGWAERVLAPRIQAVFDEFSSKYGWGNPGRVADLFEQSDPEAEGLSLSRREVTETPEFKRWFGDSKVVDSEGRPLVVYHGTSADVSEFAGSDFPGWFSAEAELAQRYVREPSAWSAPNLMPVYLSIKRPLRPAIDMNDSREAAIAELRRLGFDAGMAFNSGPSAYAVLASADFQEQLFERGYDGLIVNEDGVQTFAPVTNTQIKSAIGNNGNFDPGDADISMSRRSGQLVSPQSVLDAAIGESTRVLEDAIRRGGQMAGLGRTSHVLGMLGNVAVPLVMDGAVVRKVFIEKHAGKLDGIPAGDIVRGLYRPALVFKQKGKPNEYELVLPVVTKQGPLTAAIVVDGDRAAVKSIYPRSWNTPESGPGLRKFMANMANSKLVYADEYLATIAATGNEDARAEAGIRKKAGSPGDQRPGVAGLGASARETSPAQTPAGSGTKSIARPGAPVNQHFIGWGDYRALAAKFGRVPNEISLLRWIGDNYRGDWEDAPSFSARQPTLWRDELGRLRMPTGKLAAYYGGILNTWLAKVGLNYMSPELKRQFREMKIQLQKAQDVTIAVAREGFKMSEAERELVSDIIEGELKTGVVPPAHAVQMAMGMQAVLGQQTDEMVALGMLSKDSADMWRGKYLPRFYKPKLADIKDEWSKALQSLIGRKPIMAGIQGKRLKSRGQWQTVRFKELPKWEALGWQVRDPDYDPNTARPYTEVQIWRDFTREEREKMGESRDAIFRFAMGYQQAQRDIAYGKLFKGIADNIASKREREGWRQVPDGTVEGTGVKRYGALAGMWVPDEVLQHLKAMDSGSSPAMQMYRKAMALWKEGKVVLNPVSHANNVLSNITMAHFAGVSYWDQHKYAKAAYDLATGKGYYQEAKDAGLMLGTMGQEELMQMLPPELQALVHKQRSAGGKLVDGAFNALTFSWTRNGEQKGLRKWMGKAYEAEDVFFRYMIYADARERGMAPADAVDHSQRYMFTYDDLPIGAQRIRDFGLPFFAYTYKVIPALLHTAANYPHRLLAPAGVLYAINAAAYALAAGEDDEDWVEKLRQAMTNPERRAEMNALEEEERKNLPPWMKGFVTIGAQKAIRLGTDDVLGLPIFWDVGQIMPGGNLFDTTNNTGGIGTPQSITPSHPLLTTMAAMFYNRDTFFGKDIVDKNDTSGEGALKRTEWLWRQYAPAIAFGNYHWERALNILAQQTGEPVSYWPWRELTGVDKQGMPITPDYIALQTVGIKVRPADLERSEEMAKGQRDALIRDIDKELRNMRRANQAGYMSDENLDREIERARVKKERLRDGLTVDGEERP